MTEAGGVAAAVDFVGAKATAEFAIAALRKGGAYVVVDLFGGEIMLPLPLTVFRGISIHGSYVGNLTELKELIDLVRAGKVKPLPVEEVPFEQVKHALERLRTGQVTGRLVLARETA